MTLYEELENRYGPVFALAVAEEIERIEEKEYSLQRLKAA